VRALFTLTQVVNNGESKSFYRSLQDMTRCGSLPFAKMTRMVDTCIQFVLSVAIHMFRPFATEEGDNRILVSSNHDIHVVQVQGSELCECGAPVDTSDRGTSRGKMSHAAATAAERVPPQDNGDYERFFNVVSAELTAMSQARLTTVE